MALKIDEDCINCDMCEPECPNEAITLGVDIYEINVSRCTECFGHYNKPQCVLVCPIDCIAPDPENVEDETALTEKLQRLYA